MSLVLLMVNTKYTVCLSLPGSQAKSIEYLRFTNCYGKANKEAIIHVIHVLAERHMIGHRLFGSEPLGNV